jgi:CheY-like chemotaxis protein/anti-sigma regulatory factor (Ser/Thr protein kinase)
MGDAERLQQVIWNLVANGLKFTPSGGAVVVEIGSEADFATLTVSDDGPGIVAAELPRIFDPFYQVDTGSTRRHGGMGLGLAIVKHLVEQHHGSVSAESLGPNRGTTFTVRLPLEMGAAAATAERPPVATASLAGVRLVVIDDGPDSRARVASALSFAGAITREAGSSREGLWLVSTFRPHVIVCDLGMPDEDGFELITRLRELNDEDGGRTPALALTAHGSPADQLRALTAGYQMHLAKPVEVDTLINAVIQVIGLGR